MKYRRHQNIYRPYNLPKNALLTSSLQLLLITKSKEEKRNGRKIMSYFRPHLEVKSKHLRINFQMMRRQWFGKLEFYKAFHIPGTVNQINLVYVFESQILQHAIRKIFPRILDTKNAIFTRLLVKHGILERSQELIAFS